MTIDQTTTDEIVKRVVQAAAPEQIILFGSAACGTMHEDSDIDLFVVVSKAVENRFKTATRIRRNLSGMQYPFDIIVHTSETVRDWGHVPGTLLFAILREGKLLYERT